MCSGLQGIIKTVGFTLSLCEMEELHETRIFKIIYITKRHIVFCLYAESYVIKAVVTF